MRASIKFAVFDCDGTLVDSQYAINAGMEHAWAAEGLTTPGRLEMRRQVGLPLVEAIANLHPAGDPQQHQRMANNFRNAFSDPSISILDDEPLYPGCLEVLHELFDAGIILGIATGKGRRGLEATLERHGLQNHFHVLKTADDGPGKPNPQILLEAMAEVGAAPTDTIMIGDTVFDISTAVNAKISSLGVSWGYHDPKELLSAGAALVADHYFEIPSLLAKIWKAK